MSRLFSFVRENAQEDSASAIENIKNKCRSVLAVAAVSTVVLAGVLPVSNAFAMNGVPELVCTTATNEAELCEVDSGNSSHELGGANYYALDSNNGQPSDIVGGSVATDKDGSVYTHTVFDEDGNEVGTIVYSNSDGKIIVSLQEGVSVVIRTQNSDVYEYYEFVDGDEFVVQSSSAWLYSVSTPAKPVYKCVSLNPVAEILKGENTEFEIVTEVEGDVTVEGYEVNFGDGAGAAKRFARADAIGYTYEALPGDGEQYEVVATVSFNVAGQTMTDTCSYVIEGAKGSGPEVPPTGAFGVASEFATESNTLSNMALVFMIVGASMVVARRSYLRGIEG